MAAALQLSRNGTSSSSMYPRVVMNEFEFGDNRYPTLPTQRRSTKSPSVPSSSATDRNWESKPTDIEEGRSAQPNFDSTNVSLSWVEPVVEQRKQPEPQHASRSSSRQDTLSPDTFNSPLEQSQEPQRTSLSYALPHGAARRVVERYSLDNRPQSRATDETKPAMIDTAQDTIIGRGQPAQHLRADSPQGRTSPNPSSSIRRPSLPLTPSATSPSSANQSQFPPIMPLSASPMYVPPVAPNHRAFPQQPTYVNQSHSPNPIQTVYTPIAPPEEVCVECAMRDQDMADVDVTSPGAWERSSDALFEELKARELEDEANGVVIDNPTRPRIRGGLLSEQNVKVWLSINPREPASRQQTLISYVKSQRKLLEAEAVAHARAMQEAKQLDNRMRDAYSQLRRSAYDMGSSSSPADDSGGVRIKPPLSPNTVNQSQNHVKSHSREITLLENGMIVEHVDVRKEEKEARDRKKREEKRARKSSRGSMMDVTSIISAQSNGPPTENGLKPYSRYSNSSSARPTSVLTAPLDRPELPRAYSTASFSDVHSLGSSSPRRTRFFGMKNLSAGWRSQDSLAPSGISGSMVDMHVALQREAHRQGSRPFSTSPIDLNTPRRSKLWSPTDLEEGNSSQMLRESTIKKKKGGLAKIWRIVTGKNEGQQRDHIPGADGQEDDLPLAPPPPLSYLVDRGPVELHSGGMRHGSTPSLPSAASPKFPSSSPGMSPPTAPSSSLPSPVSLRTFGADVEIADGRNGNGNDPDHHEQRFGVEETSNKLSTRKSVHSLASDMELRRTPSTPNAPLPSSTSNALIPPNNVNRPVSLLSRDKSLPPLPPGEQPARILPSDLRPRTLYTYDPRTLPSGSSPPHDFLPPQAPFRTKDVRRQSFGGTSSRPNVQTMPITKPVDFGSRYDEFGISQRSLGRLENLQENPNKSSSVPTKRKSKFGLSSLLGKKHDKREPEVMQENHQFPTMGYNPYDNQDDLTTTGYATSTSRHSALSSGPTTSNMRMSVTSRKALEELVQQDADFVAYRYPSNDQRLDLLR